MLKGLKRALNATPEELASPIFQERIHGFLTRPVKRRKIVVEVGGKKLSLKRKTLRNGCFFAVIDLPELDCPDLGETVIPMKLLRMPVEGSRRTSQASQLHGSLFMVPPRGVSVISDIDDTIKLTQATSKRSMLVNTFLRPFEAIDGMASMYQDWSELGCDFHYVSSSPWQLYEPLAELCQSCDFPAGSMHLRYFRVRDEMFKRFRPLRRNKKVAIIANILKRLPQRRFVLIGDSGEKDPEVYRFLARRYPDRVAAILIHNLSARPLGEKRAQKLQRVTPNTEVRIYDHPAEIADVVERLCSAT